MNRFTFTVLIAFSLTIVTPVFAETDTPHEVIGKTWKKIHGIDKDKKEHKHDDKCGHREVRRHDRRDRDHGNSHVHRSERRRNVDVHAHINIGTPYHYGGLEYRMCGVHNYYDRCWAPYGSSKRGNNYWPTNLYGSDGWGRRSLTLVFNFNKENQNTTPPVSTPPTALGGMTLAEAQAYEDDASQPPIAAPQSRRVPNGQMSKQILVMPPYAAHECEGIESVHRLGGQTLLTFKHETYCSAYPQVWLRASPQP
jgi:hypothetical protein